MMLKSLSLLVVLVGVAIILVDESRKNVVLSLFGLSKIGDDEFFQSGVSALKQSASTVDVAPCRIAVGYNSNLDIVVSGVAVLKALGLTPSPGKPHSKLDTLQDIQEAFGHFLGTGGAAERFVSDREVFLQLVRKAESVEGVVFSIGGNAALMGSSFAESGCQVLLGGPVGPRFKSMMRPSITMLEEMISDVDEVHMILEYQKGETWGSNVAPRANRLIVVSDEANSQITTLAPFHTKMRSFDPSVFLLSGLNQLEAQTQEFAIKRIEDVRNALLEDRRVLPSLPVHLECASMAQELLIKTMISRLFPLVNSVGLNEQELWWAYSAVGGGEDIHSQLTRKAPDVGAVVLAIAHLLRYTRAIADDALLSRIHFHSLGYHVVAQLSDKETSPAMRTTMVASVANGALAAPSMACPAAIHSPSSSVLEYLLPFASSPSSPSRSAAATFRPSLQYTTAVNTYVPQDNAVLYWVEPLSDGQFVHYALAGVFVCRRPERTVGLGDNISAMGSLKHFCGAAP